MSWLARFVDDISVLVPDPARPAPIERMPDGRTMFAIRELISGDGDAWVAGPRTRALFKTTAGVARAITVSFKPGWAATLFGVRADALTDRYITLGGLWGRAGNELGTEIAALRSVPEILDRLARALASRADDRESSSAHLARRAVHLLEREPSVEAAARELRVSSRHLRRVFVEHVGVGPKDYVRSLRLRRAVERVDTADWSRVASDAGYYDQAHLITDFRDLVGLTPGAFAKRRAAAPLLPHA